MKKQRKVSLKVEFTEGYQERFTAAILKIYSARKRKEEQEDGIYGNLSQCHMIKETAKIC